MHRKMLVLTCTDKAILEARLVVVRTCIASLASQHTCGGLGLDDFVTPSGCIPPRI